MQSISECARTPMAASIRTNTFTAADRPDSTSAMWCRTLNEDVTRLDQAVQILLAKLSPITASHPVSQHATEGAPPFGGSPLACELTALRQRMYNVIRAVEDSIGSLEV